MSKKGTNKRLNRIEILMVYFVVRDVHRFLGTGPNLFIFGFSLNCWPAQGHESLDIQNCSPLAAV